MYKRIIRLALLMEILFIITIIFLLAGSNVMAAEKTKKEVPKVLVVFSSENGEIDQHQRTLDMLLGRFAEDIVFKSVSQVEKKDFEAITHLFYYGQQKKILSPAFVEMVQDYTGVMVAMGHNVEQIGGRFSFLESFPAEVAVDQFISVHAPDKKFSFIPQLIFDLGFSEYHSVETLITGKIGKAEYPFFVRCNNSYYFASPDIYPPFSIAMAEGLYDVFEEENASLMMHPGYIRLEDIHPLVDHHKVMAIAKILKRKEIPYMVAVIPVYTNPETGKQYHFSDSPGLLKALKYMQKNGGSIVLHGYTHQFRLSETGEGFEFWDIEHNMPIYHNQDEKVTVKTREDFESRGEYENYLSQRKVFEREYIEKKLTKGIQELVNYGLYPLAFEAPHYTMSQHGYQVTSEYFSTYTGQLQISDQDCEIMTTVPYITKPTFLHGMTLLPETMGYVAPGNPRTIKEMLNRAQDYQFVRGGMVAGFYHPYLGVELFEELIARMEEIPNISWIDLKQRNNRVSAENVAIWSENGSVKAKVNRCGLFIGCREYLTYHINLLIKTMVWVMAGIGALAVGAFICYIFISGDQNEKGIRGEEIG